MTARLMADSVDTNAMPEWVSIKAFYVNGRYAASQAAIDAWKGPRVKINVTGDPAVRSNELDVERFDATPADIPRWADAMLAMGEKYLDTYVNEGNFGAALQAIGRRPVGIRLATLDGRVIHTLDGHPLVACQAIGSQLLGFNCDLSIVWDGNWHPGWETNFPAGDKLQLSKLADQAQTDLGRLAAFIRGL